MSHLDFDTMARERQAPKETQACLQYRNQVFCPIDQMIDTDPDASLACGRAGSNAMIGVATQPIASMMHMMNARFETPRHPFRRYFRQATLLIATMLPALAMAQTAPASGSAVTTASGLVFTLIQQGKGPSPTASDTVKVHYRGTLMDGKEFDSSYKRGQPLDFPLNGVIKCWTEGVQRLQVGGKAKLICPPAIAYGERGAGGVVPPNATLQFEVELLGIAGR